MNFHNLYSLVCFFITDKRDYKLKYLNFMHAWLSKNQRIKFLQFKIIKFVLLK